MLGVSKRSGWLSNVVPKNMYRMFVTLEVSKLTGWLNDVARMNICAMSVTLEVSQLEMSALKASKSWNREDMLVMAETPQLEMGPYVVVAEPASALNSRTANHKDGVRPSPKV